MQQLLCSLTLCTFAAATMAAENPFIGIWEMNAAKSKPDPSAPKVETQTIKYFVDGSVLKSLVTVNGTPSAHPTVYNGQEHEYGGSSGLRPTHIIPTAKAATLETVFKRDGKTIGTRKNTLSADGRTMTVISEGVKPDGARYRSVTVFDKQ